MNDISLSSGETTLQGKKRLILAASAFILCVNVAFPIFGASVVNTAMMTSMHADRSLLGLMVSINMIVTGITAPLIGAIVSKAGARLAMIVGCTLLVIGSLAMNYLVRSPMQAVLVFGLTIGLSMSAAGFVSCQACVAGWFVEDRAKPFAVLYATIGLGGFIAAPLIAEVISVGNDWHKGWLVFTAAGLAALLLSVLVVRDAPRSSEVAAVGSPGEGAGKSGLASTAVWVAILSIMAAGASSSLYTAHGLAMLHDFGHAPSDAAFSMSIMAVSTLLGNFAIGAYGKRLGVRRVLTAFTLVFALGILLLATAHSSFLLYTYPVLLGAGYGGIQVGAMALLSESTAPSRFAAISGVAIAMMTVSAAITPLVGGWLFDNFHTYFPLFAVLCGLNILMAFVLSLSQSLFPRQAGGKQP